MENDLHKLEAERDKLNLRVQQGELQLAKLRLKITDLESEVAELGRKNQEIQSQARKAEERQTSEFQA